MWVSAEGILCSDSIAVVKFFELGRASLVVVGCRPWLARFRLDFPHLPFQTNAIFNMLTPFQRLLYCSASGSRKLDFILAASGPTIRSFNVEDGTLVSSWSHLAPSADHKAPSEEHVDGTEPPEKRRKLSNDRGGSETPSTEIVVEGQSQRRPRPKHKAPLVPSVISLSGTLGDDHVIAVTGEDKSLRVLELLRDGRLNQLSQR